MLKGKPAKRNGVGKPTKSGMATMFVKLENSLKTAMAKLHGVLGQILGSGGYRIED